MPVRHEPNLWLLDFDMQSWMFVATGSCLVVGTATGDVILIPDLFFVM